MNKELFNIFVILFPLTGIGGLIFHYTMALYFIHTQPLLSDQYYPFPKWFKISLVINVFITAICGLIILFFYEQ